MQYEVILFDADDTLFDFKRAEEYALKQALSSYGVKDDIDNLLLTYRQINKKIWVDFENGLIAADQINVERFRRFCQQVGLAFAVEELGVRYIDSLAEAAFLIEGARELVVELAGRYKLGLITNGLARVQRSRLFKSDLGQYFQAIVISEEVGVTKPHPGIFEHAFASLLHSEKGTALIVGDSLTSDIRGGINFGIDTCWYNPGKGANKSDMTPTYEIGDLKELAALLG